MYKVILLSPIPASVVRSFFSPTTSKLGIDIDVVPIKKYDIDVFRKELPNADIVIGDYSFAIPITSEMVDLMQKVRLIQQPSTGFDRIDIEACARKHIPVANIGGANSIAVAEYTITVALVLLKRILSSHENLLQGKWIQGEIMNSEGELNGKTWGIIGLGRIGRQVSSKAQSFGANIVYHDSNRKEPSEEEKLGVSYRTLEELLSESDVVTIHAPLKKETDKMIGERELRLMKPSAVFVNPSRGEIVDEQALAKAVREGWISGAAVDVYTKEPPPQDHPLLLAARDGAPVIVTSHIAGATSETRLRIIHFTIENCVRALTGQEPKNVVSR